MKTTPTRLLVPRRASLIPPPKKKKKNPPRVCKGDEEANRFGIHLIPTITRPSVCTLPTHAHIHIHTRTHTPWAPSAHPTHLGASYTVEANGDPIHLAVKAGTAGGKAHSAAVERGRFPRRSNAAFGARIAVRRAYLNREWEQKNVKGRREREKKRFLQPCSHHH